MNDLANAARQALKALECPLHRARPVPIQQPDRTTDFCALRSEKEEIMKKHTPGPWRVGTSNTGKSCVWLDGHAEPKNEMGPDSTWIDCNTEANACLIAAAPELLEFARLVLRGLKVGNFKAMPVINLDDDAEQLDMRSLADIASEIIAKAEGI